MTFRTAARRVALAAVLLASGFVGESEAIPITGPIFNPATGNNYYLLQQADWPVAEAEAVLLGGHLVTINDAAENAFVFATFGNFGNTARHLWIGFNDVATEGAFGWVSGQPVTFTNWAPGEPNNFNNIEDYVHIYAPGPNGGLWNDLGPATSFGAGLFGVAEVTPIPEPATMLLIGTGIAGLVARSRRRRHSRH